MKLTVHRSLGYESFGLKECETMNPQYGLDWVENEWAMEGHRNAVLLHLMRSRNVVSVDVEEEE